MVECFTPDVHIKRKYPILKIGYFLLTVRVQENAQRSWGFERRRYIASSSEQYRAGVAEIRE
jgi:hypothetical protein